MTKNYFAIEREGKCVDHVYIKRDDGTIAFEDIMSMSYEKMKTYENISEFVTGIMDAANTYFQENDAQTIVNLIGEDDVFIWGVFIGPGDSEEELKYAFIDWGKYGMKYRYEKD